MEYPDDIFTEFLDEFGNIIRPMIAFLNENKAFFEFMFNTKEREVFTTSIDNVLSFDSDAGYSTRIKKAQMAMSLDYSEAAKEADNERKEKMEMESKLTYALKEIDELKDEVKLRDSKIEQLEDEVSDLKKELEEVYEE